MGRLLDGEWVTDDLGADAQGRYVRRATQFRNQVVADPNSSNSNKVSEQIVYPAEKGRYRLIVGSPCGWSHRVLLVRAWKGLEDVIPVTFTNAFMGEQGWTFDNPNNEVDAVNKNSRKGALGEEYP